MHRVVRYISDIGLTIVLLSSALAQELPGDANAGRRTAETFCVSCHQINPTESLKVDNAPDFPVIANIPTTTALSLNVFFRTSHRNMPDFQLTRAQADDLIAYILSLKEKK